MNQMVLKGDYLTNQQGDFITALDILDEDGQCKVKVMKVADLSFKPEWFPISLRGYHQATEVPDGTDLNMENSEIMWNYRIPENGAVFFFKTKKERDEF